MDKVKMDGKDGLSKKERRALKVKAKQDSGVNHNDQLDRNVQAVASQQRKCLNTENEVNRVTHSHNNEDLIIKMSETKIKNGKPELKDQLTKRKEKQSQSVEQQSKVPEQKATENIKAGLSKAELKAQRRALQEAQRNLKLASKEKVVEEQQNKEKHDKNDAVKKDKKDMKKPQPVHNKVELVSHLYTTDIYQQDCEGVVNRKDVHPAFVRLGSQFAAKTIMGSNARSLAFLSALKCLVNDLQTPPKQEFCRYLESVIQNCVVYLQRYRPLAVSMTNALRHFRWHLSQIDTSLAENEIKSKLIDAVDIYIRDDIAKAGEAISLKVTQKICNGDVILTYGCSSLIRKILLDAHKKQKQFKVIVVDGRPLLEGKEMLRRLTIDGVDCTYVFINAVSYVMDTVTKVLFGAHALLANGSVVSRMGTSCIALVAKAFNKPALVCCEAYKFSEKVQLDSFVYNEIGDPDNLITDSIKDISPVANWKKNRYLTPTNLLYDVTPPVYLTAVVTELGFLPFSSVPVVLRRRPIDFS